MPAGSETSPGLAANAQSTNRFEKPTPGMKPMLSTGSNFCTVNPRSRAAPSKSDLAFSATSSTRWRRLSTVSVLGLTRKVIWRRRSWCAPASVRTLSACTRTNPCSVRTGGEVCPGCSAAAAVPTAGGRLAGRVQPRSPPRVALGSSDHSCASRSNGLPRPASATISSRSARTSASSVALGARSSFAISSVTVSPRWKRSGCAS